jgi:integrase
MRKSRKNQGKSGDENEMNIAAQKINATPAANAEEMARRIKDEAPTLAQLNDEQLTQIAKIVMTQRLAVELNTAVELSGISWAKEKEIFLNDTKSIYTMRAYASALDRIEAWTRREGLNPLSITAVHADQYIRELKAEGRAPASVIRDINAASSFYSFLERYYTVRNPFRGTRIRPKQESVKEIVIPSKEEYDTIIDALPPLEKAIVLLLSLRGLRVGALPTLEKKGNRYYGKSKGKDLMEGDIKGITLPERVIKAIETAGLNQDKPFKGMTKDAIGLRVTYQTRKLYHAGQIRAAYSCHDFRHYFAVTEYQKDKDIFRVSRLLNHAGVQITQTYLRSLGVSV